MMFFKSPQSSKDTELDLTRLNDRSNHLSKYHLNKRKRKQEIYRTRLWISIVLIINLLILRFIHHSTTDMSFLLINFLSFSFVGSLTGILFGYFQLGFVRSSKYLLLATLLFILLQHSIDSTTIATVYLLSFFIMFIAGKLCHYLLQQTKKPHQIPTQESEATP